MPYRWTQPDTAPEESGAVGVSEPLARLDLWPHQSLTAQGLVVFAGASGLLALAPLMALVGSAALWVVLGFLGATMAAMFWAIGRNRRTLGLRETLTLWPDRVHLIRVEAGQNPPRIWEANPHWVDLRLHARGGPVPAYLTLRGAGREVELGAFLTPEERVALHAELAGRLRG